MAQLTEPQTHQAVAPENLLSVLIINLLTPMFLGAAMGDIALARAAASCTVSDFRARSRADLIIIAQIVAFGLAAIGSLSLSLEDDVSVPMGLRLRSSANACTRSAEQNRRALDWAQSQTDDLPPPAQVAVPYPEPSEAPERPEPAAPEPFLTEAAEQLLAAESAARLQAHPVSPAGENSDKSARAADLLKQALDLRARIPSLPKAGRKAAIDRIAKLTNTARLLTGARA